MCLIDKYYYMFFDSLVLIGTFLITFSLYLCCSNNISVERIRFYFVLGIIIFLFGNCHNFGNLFIEYYLFTSIKYQFLPIKPQNYKYEVPMYYHLYEKANINEDSNEQENLVNR